eukprot:CAMPEP_0198291454 /NCGR_PEP_ID=MMETSP1449-20131203/8978_1 /TAXON_ID=420275 /ORGANISM="Attheya septentrionalis, Strain CCMP2084" /LENGTH=329 /DNA_ID=CAMNT_0043990095 /DNA_START=106 /DNA_END=1095 /DNA_ORIENTATION=+
MAKRGVLSVVMNMALLMLGIAIGKGFHDNTHNTQNTNKNMPSLEYGTGSMFDLIAQRYDFVNRALALNMDLSWRRIMVTQLLDSILAASASSAGTTTKNYQPLLCLDLATGTADVSILLAQQAASSSASSTMIQIKGVDPSANMIAVGRDKVKEEGLQNIISLELGDARDLSKFIATDEEGRMDGVTMAFGIRNVPEQERNKVFCEIHQVLKGRKRGKVAILEFSEPTLEEGGLVGYYLARPFIRYIVPWMGAMLSGKPREYLHLQNSIAHFPNAAEFTTFLHSLLCPLDQTTKTDTNDDPQQQQGSFRVDSVTQMNFGSVQLYLATAI